MTETDEENNVSAVIDKKRPIILAISTLVVLIIVVSGFCVYFLTDKNVSKIVLLVFLCLLIALGIGMIFYIEYQRKRANERKDQGARRWIKHTFEAQYVRPKPSAPPLSERSSWALNPRKWSNVTALPGYTSAVSKIDE